MKIELQTGEKGVCLKLLAETGDEERVLHVINGAEATTVLMGVETITYLVSKPMALKEPEAKSVLPAEV